MKNPTFQRDIVLIQFPFSDSLQSKVRPVIVMSNDNYNRKFNDFIAIPLTSNLEQRDHALIITNKEMESGNLVVDSQVKVDRIYSLEQGQIVKKIGRIKKETHKNLRDMLLKII